jgi:GT2 family glycosyltransferase
MRYCGRPQFRYVHEPVPGLSAARNRGIEESKGAIIAFLDDDVIVDANWLANLSRCYRDTGAAIVGGKATLLVEADQPPWFGPFFRELLSEIDLGPIRRDVPDGRGLYGVNLSFDAAALKSVGGFDPRLGRQAGQMRGGEEIAVVARLASESARIVYEPDAAVQHIVGKERLTWAYFLGLAQGSASTKHVREPDRGFLWQILRVGQSVQRVIQWHARFSAAYIRGSDSHTLRSLGWEATSEMTYLTLRAQRLLAPFEGRVVKHRKKSYQPSE